MVAAFERISTQGPRVARVWAVSIVACASIASGAVLAPLAPAGEYHVYTCRTPDGEPAPADGWSPSAAGTATVTEDTCSQPGGALVAGLAAQTTRLANTNIATWAFEAPSGETLAAATVWRAGDADGGAEVGGSYEMWLAAPTEKDVFEECSYLASCDGGVGNASQPLSPVNRVAVPSANLGAHLYLRASCGGISEYSCPDKYGDSNGYAAVVYLYAADLTLEQDSPPTAFDVSGELASNPTLDGTSDLAFSASDPGSGVYQAVFSVDGQVVQTTRLDENEGHCKDVGETSDGLPAFLYVQPCLPSVSADVGFDTTRVANGEHHLVVSVTDAAGNSATVLDRNVTIDNPTPPGGPNGTNASAQATLSVAWTTTRHVRLTSAFGAAHTIVGRLTGAGGTPIGAALLDVLSTSGYVGAVTASMPNVTTAANGDFTMRLPAGTSSRTLRFEYSAEVGSQPVVTRTLALSVRAGVALSVAPHTVSVGRSIFFSGRLRGGPVPAGGKLLVLEARSPGGAWLEFDVVRSDAHGRFRASYRFKFPGPADYQFRALCEAEADYPFATGASRVVGVFER
jgi:hypothetical protein